MGPSARAIVADPSTLSSLRQSRHAGSADLCQRVDHRLVRIARDTSARIRIRLPINRHAPKPRRLCGAQGRAALLALALTPRPRRVPPPCCVFAAPGCVKRQPPRAVEHINCKFVGHDEGSFSIQIGHTGPQTGAAIRSLTSPERRRAPEDHRSHAPPQRSPAHVRERASPETLRQ